MANKQVAFSFSWLIGYIEKTNSYFQSRVQQQVNTALTLRNWFIGQYIVKYEQKGKDRASYGEGLLKRIAHELQAAGLKSLGHRNLYLCKEFYKAYPKILQTLSAKSYLIDCEAIEFLQAGSTKFIVEEDALSTNANDDLLLARLSFSHFVELLKSNTATQRSFYETQTIKNNWSVRELQRAMNSMLYERTGLSSDKQRIIESINSEQPPKAEDVFRNPYMLEFLGLEEKPFYSESDLEKVIISHLQKFLLELGRGFCFEARQKRITFDNTHYRIDLVFYHRILKCHVLIDLKLGEFTHADAGQMNVYLNYYKENEMSESDNPPIGIILCAGKNETLARYATAGLSQKVFVSKYLVNLPSEIELMQIIKEERSKLE